MKATSTLMLLLLVAGCGGSDYKAAFEAYDKEVAEQQRLKSELAAEEAEMQQEIDAARQGAAAQAKSLDQLSDLSGGLKQSLGDLNLPEVDADAQAAANAAADENVKKLTKQAGTQIDVLAEKEIREIKRAHKPEIDRLTRELEKQNKRVERAAERKDAAK
jgi:hypothetical protein